MRLDEIQELRLHCLYLNQGTLENFEFQRPRCKFKILSFTIRN